MWGSFHCYHSSSSLQVESQGFLFYLVSNVFHDRGCGGIYCEQCCSRAVIINGENHPACGGCSRGETPGEAIKILLLSLFVETTTPVPQAIVFRIQDGAEFGSESVSGKSSGTAVSGTPPVNGYFEFANKTESFVCIKLLTGGNYLNEMSRPSYVACGPGHVVSSHFDPNVASTMLMILIDNPNGMPSDGRVVAHSNGAYKASPCAAVENFRQILIFSISSQGRNALLKLKTGNVLELRKGSSMKRLGLLGVFTGSVPAGEINFDTNATEFEGVYNSTR